MSKIGINDYQHYDNEFVYIAAGSGHFESCGL